MAKMVQLVEMAELGVNENGLWVSIVDADARIRIIAVIKPCLVWMKGLLNVCVVLWHVLHWK